MPLHDGIEAAEICALLPKEVQAMAQQNLMRHGRSGEPGRYDCGLHRSGKLRQNKPSAKPMVFHFILMMFLSWGLVCSVIFLFNMGGYAFSIADRLL